MKVNIRKTEFMKAAKILNLLYPQLNSGSLDLEESYKALELK